MGSLRSCLRLVLLSGKEGRLSADKMVPWMLCPPERGQIASPPGIKWEGKELPHQAPVSRLNVICTEGTLLC
jgi:hypothetical protein